LTQAALLRRSRSHLEPPDLSLLVPASQVIVEARDLATISTAADGKSNEIRHLQRKCSTGFMSGNVGQAHSSIRASTHLLRVPLGRGCVNSWPAQMEDCDRTRHAGGGGHPGSNPASHVSRSSRIVKRRGEIPKLWRVVVPRHRRCRGGVASAYSALLVARISATITVSCELPMAVLGPLT
jgi:hypothetical protein